MTHIAARYPDLVRSVVSLSGFVSLTDARQELQFGLWRDLIRTDRCAMARLMLLTGFSPAYLSLLSPEAIQRIVDDIVAHTNWDGMERQVELDTTVDVSDEACRISQPALVIGCTYDQMVPVGHARQLTELIPHALYAEMPSGHVAQVERPDQFTELLLDFLHDPTGPRSP